MYSMQKMRPLTYKFTPDIHLESLISEFSVVLNKDKICAHSFQLRKQLNNLEFHRLTN